MIDWAALEAEYVTTDASMAACAKKYLPRGKALEAFRKQVENYAKKNGWTAKRREYRAGVVARAADACADDDAAAIRELRRQEREDLNRAIAAARSLLASMEVSPGKFLFDDMNAEERAQRFERWAKIREKIQDMLYRSYDIAEKHDITAKTYDFSQMTEDELAKYLDRYRA